MRYQEVGDEIFRTRGHRKLREEVLIGAPSNASRKMRDECGSAGHAAARRDWDDLLV